MRLFVERFTSYTCMRQTICRPSSSYLSITLVLLLHCMIAHDFTYRSYFTLDTRPWIVFRVSPYQKKVSRYLKFDSGLHFRLPTRNRTAIIALYCTTSRMPRSSKDLGYGRMRKFELERGRLHSALRVEGCMRRLLLY